MKVPIYILEGSWDKTHEVPQVLPYFLAYAQSHREVEIFHRTFRTAEDINFYINKIKKGSKTLVYFACHGEPEYLTPSDGRSKLGFASIKDALSIAKEKDSIGFLHFGCCSFVRSPNRRTPLSALSKATGAAWVSGYINDVDWLSSTLLDLALISEVYYDWRCSTSKKRNTKNISSFIGRYEQLAKSLGLSALSDIATESQLIPARLIGEQQ